MQSPIISKLSEADNFGDDIVEICEKRIERLTAQRDSNPALDRDCYNRRIAANQRKIERVQNFQRLFNSQCS